MSTEPSGKDIARTSKVAYRKKIKEELSGLSSDDIQKQSMSIARQALNLEQYRTAKAISVFLSMPGKEISTREIVLQAFRDGKHVYVPYIYASKTPKLKIMDMLRVQDESDLNTLQPDAWGIPSIPPESVKGRQNALGGYGCSEDPSDSDFGSPTLDLIFMPAVAFDRSQRRLGHGKGFYDRYLTRYSDLANHSQQARKVPYLAGLALREQILPPDEILPTDEHDWKVDQVISPEW